MRSADFRGSRVALVLAAALGLAACSGEPPAPASPTDPGLATVVVMAEDAARTREWQGDVQAVNRAMLAAQTSGRVVALPFQIGDAVKAGDVVLRLTDVAQASGLQQADAALAAALAQSADADADHRRMAGLAERQLVARSQLDQAVARRDAAAAALAAARAGVRQAAQQVDYTVLRAPFDGRIGHRQVQVGEAVHPGQPLLEVVAPLPLRIEVVLPQADLARLDVARGALVRLPDGREHTVEHPVPGPAVNPATQTASVRLELGAADLGLRPGDAVAVRFQFGADRQRLLPFSAVVRRGEVHGVYVLGADQRLALRPVRLGHRDGEQVEILAGLVDGERVALDPLAAFTALKAQRQAAVEAGNG